MSTDEKSFFVEVVLNDGNQVGEAERAMLRLKSLLGTEGTHLDLRVAAEWVPKTIEYGGICRGESGGIRSAEYFNAELVAGSARQMVTIEVSNSALSELSEQFREPEELETINAQVCEILRDQITHWLSYGGEYRWNPVENSVVQLNHLPLDKQTA